MSRNCVFQVADLSYSYDSVPALQSFSLRIERGERVTLVGANGSGKSTLLRLLAGLAFPQSGTIAFYGEPLTPASLDREEFFFDFRRRVGLIFQNPDVQLFNATVFDEVAFGPLQLRWPKRQILTRVEEQLELLGISSLRDRPPHRLSGGEKKRVALASVLVLDPEILLLDEPTAALDPGSQKQILDLMSLWRDGSRTVVTATHDLDTLEETADRCCVLKDGRLEADGDPLSVLHDVALLERARLIRRHLHVHQGPSLSPHPHVHVAEEKPSS